MDVARTAAKEKVVRVAVAGAASEIAEGVEGAMPRRAARGAERPDRFGIHAGSGGASATKTTSHELVALDEAALKRKVENLKLKGFADEELAGAPSTREGACWCGTEASSWERYRARSSCPGSLTCWPPRTPTRVFGANPRRSSRTNNCQLLRVLVNIMAEASTGCDPTAVACHDLGEFATHYPAGKVPGAVTWAGRNTPCGC